MKSISSDGVVNVDNQLRVCRHLILEQRLHAARLIEQLTVLRDTSQFRQSTCYVRHHLPAKQSYFTNHYINIFTTTTTTTVLLLFIIIITF